MAQETGTPGKGRRIYRVRLSDGGRAKLRELADSRAAAYRHRHARILLLADEDRDDGGRTDCDIAPVLEIGVPAAGRVRRRCAGEGLEAALVRRGQRNRKRRSLDGGGEAKLVALACPQPPEGRSRWTMQLLADRPGGLGTVDTISDETVRKTLKKRVTAHPFPDAGEPSRWTVAAVDTKLEPRFGLCYLRKRSLLPAASVRRGRFH